MLAATVARHFEHFHLAAASQGDVDGSDSDNGHAINITSPGFHLLSSQNFNMAPPTVNYQQLVARGSASQPQQQQRQQQQQQQQQIQGAAPNLALPSQDAQHSLYGSEMTYLGQTLIPSGYPILAPPQHRSLLQHSSSSGYSSSVYDGRPLQGWASSSPGTDASQPQQRQFYDEYQQHQGGLQAGSRSSLSSNRASIELSAQQQQQQHLVYTQQQSPQSEYVLGLQQQQHHHHHSLPTQSPSSNAHINDYGDSSSRERELGGAPNMVGLDGMPEPAPRPKGPKLKFTRADDALLIELKEGKNLTWKQIADFFPGRSSGTLQVRYCTKLKAKTTVWTDEMVQRLRNAMAEYENDRWRIIASKVGQGFSAVACQDRALELEIEEAGGSFMTGELDEEDEYSNSTTAAHQ